ncbi:MAG: hypothetical protein HC853_09845 [Anaerolineae bacterium]|nr:hypothetical protein [Anaerolineae bacterium]
MNKLNLRYLFINIAATLFIGVLTQVIIVTTLSRSQQNVMLSAGWIGSFWMNLLVGGMIAILGARKAASIYTDPRIGRVVGTAMGLWTGLGALIGLILSALFLRVAYRADQIPAGQVVFFGLLSLAVCIIGATIAGRETAHPPEEEEA